MRRAAPSSIGVMAGIDPSLTGLDEGKVPAGAVEGANDFGGTGYGAQPPVGGSSAFQAASSSGTSFPFGLVVEDQGRGLRRQVAPSHQPLIVLLHGSPRRRWGRSQPRRSAGPPHG